MSNVGEHGELIARLLNPVYVLVNPPDGLMQELHPEAAIRTMKDAAEALRDRDRAVADADRMRKAAASAVAVANEARDEWDKAPTGMKAGKLLIALSGHLPGYRKDIDEIHAALRDTEAAPVVRGGDPHRPDGTTAGNLAADMTTPGRPDNPAGGAFLASFEKGDGK